MRKQLCGLLLLVVATVGGALGQSAPDRMSNSETFPVFSLNPAPVPGATIAVVGQAGQATWYFWASANYQLGNVLSPIGSIQNAPNTLSVSNYVTIFPTQYPGGVTNVDILATTTPTAPTGACNCAVATHLTHGGANFQSNSLSSYTVSILTPGAYSLSLRNNVVGSGSTHLQLVNTSTGAVVSDLSSLIEIAVNGTDTQNQQFLNLTDGTAGGGGSGILFVHPNNDTGGFVSFNLVADGASLGTMYAVNSALNLTPMSNVNWSDANGILKLPVLQTTAVAFANLGTCNSAAEGKHRAITNSNTTTWGATISGTGSFHVSAYCDGTNWTVEAQ